VAMHGGASLRVGLDGPSGTWISPVREGDSGSLNTGEADAAISNGSQPSGSPVPPQSHGAVVVWENKWPAGMYNITLTGSGTADLYLQGTGDAITGARTVGFARGVRESTITLPATSASIISVGCTINKPSWHNLHSVDLGLQVPVLDAAGGLLDPSGATRDAIGGEPCWFSSAGPTLTGVQKPEIMAPGAAIIGAMSAQAHPPSMASIFTNPDCPGKTGTSVDTDCQQIDATHAVALGTSFSAPIVAGVAAILLQHDPTLTQDGILAALQGGAHPLRGKSAFEDQTGTGEVDVLGAVAAADRQRDPISALPASDGVWLTLGADAYLADGSTPLGAIVELRSAGTGNGPAPPADGFDPRRLGVYALVDGVLRAGAVQSLARRGPGVWVATLGPPGLPAGLGGSRLTVGVTFDGRDIVARKSVPIATDVWNAEYAPKLPGGCVLGRTASAIANGEAAAGIAAFLVLASARRRPPSARKARASDARRLPRSVERELEQNWTDHFVDGDRGDRKCAQGRADGGELARDDRR
jgi:subtilisin family serine protease